MNTDAPLVVVWEFERVFRAPYTTPPFELWTPLLRGVGLPPSQVIVNRAYHAKRRPNGTVLHRWAEYEHVDCESVWEGGWEIPVYDANLHELSEWLVLAGGQRLKVVVPEKPSEAPMPLLTLRNEDHEGLTFHSKLEKGEWIRQSLNPSGKYVEERQPLEASTLFHVKQRPLEWPYDAVLITTEGFEEKFILRGELS